jgi:hypothetical protein
MARLLEVETLPIAVTRHGEWLHGGTPLHPRVAELFMRSVVPRTDGSYILKIGFDEQPLQVEVAAFFVRLIELDEHAGEARAAFVHLSDGAREPLRPETLEQGDDNALYCRVERHGLLVPARFLATPYNALADHVEPDGGGFCLRLGGRRWPIAAFERGARPVPSSG